MFEEFVNARQTEVRLATRQAEQRMEWEQFFRIDRLERALRSAKGRLQIQPRFSAEAKITNQGIGRRRRDSRFLS